MDHYEIVYSEQGWIKVEKDNYNEVYKIPYSSIKDGRNCPQIKNRFIVYILQGITVDSKDYIYVGKSTKGLEDRPGSHESKYSDWTYCYILTRHDSKFLNDGVIQYLEDSIRRRVDLCSDYFINTTNKTSSNTANDRDIENSEEYLKDIYQRLFVLGLDLSQPKAKKIDDFVNGENEINQQPKKRVRKAKGDCEYYYLEAKKSSARAKAIIHDDGKITVLSKSVINPETQKSFLQHHYMPLRQKLIEDRVIIGNTFVEDYTFSSVSAAAAVILGRSAAGPVEWKDKNGVTFKERTEKPVRP